MIKLGMVEEEPLSIQLNKDSEEILHNQVWQGEKKTYSSEFLFIKGKVGGEEKGQVFADLIIQREYDPSIHTFKELERLVNILRIDVFPNFRRKGLGTKMMEKLEGIAQKFGASRIEGIVYASKIKETPGLLNFYRKNGFKIERKWQQGYKYKVIKLLQN